MRHILNFFLCFFLISLIGCREQALNPFYTDEYVVKIAEMNGAWETIEDSDHEVKEELREIWHIDQEKKNLAIIESGAITSHLTITIFQIDHNYFTDLTAGDLANGTVGLNWISHVIPTHSLYKIDLSADQLILLPLDLHWLKEAVEKGEFQLPYANAEDNAALFTASAQEWIDFLEQNQDLENAFNPKERKVLVRNKIADDFFRAYEGWQQMFNEDSVKISSRAEDYITDENYQKMVDLGEAVLPLLMTKIEAGAKNHWPGGEFFLWYAIRDISGVDLSQPTQFLSEQEIALRYLAWWRERLSKILEQKFGKEDTSNATSAEYK